MNHHYRDIIDKLGEPLWWDEHAVPRYCGFSPREIAGVYASNCVLLLIECQDCGAPFPVCMADDPYSTPTALQEAVEADAIHYGDPPNTDCCAAGSTMNSVPRRVMEFWTRNAGFAMLDGLGWTRRPELEREIKCEWAER